jgi:hypothetical protein
MSDGELQKLAEDAASLTDVARQALQNEVVGRRLNITLQDFFPRDELNLRELVTIRKFRDLPEALLAEGSLESAGIECFLLDDNMVRLDWFISNFIGGIKLQLAPEDANIASEVLDEPVPEKDTCLHDKQHSQMLFNFEHRNYCSFAYSALASFRIGTSGLASFQRAKKSW